MKLRHTKRNKNNTNQPKWWYRRKRVQKKSKIPKKIRLKKPIETHDPISTFNGVYIYIFAHSLSLFIFIVAFAESVAANECMGRFWCIQCKKKKNKKKKARKPHMRFLSTESKKKRNKII